MKTYEIIERGQYMMIDGDLKEAPVGYQFEAENCTSTRARELSVATTGPSETDQELSELKIKYEEVFGKKPHGRSGKEKLAEEIAAFEADKSTGSDSGNEDSDV